MSVFTSQGKYGFLRIYRIIFLLYNCGLAGVALQDLFQAFGVGKVEYYDRKLIVAAH